MVTTAELQRRGLRYAVSVDAAATVASLQALDRQGLPYRVEVADGATMASRAALEARGLRYFVPVAVGATAASKATLERQGLRYAVQVDADILPADRRTLEQQGLAYFVKVDSSGNSVATAAGGALLLADETNGFATDFTYAVDAERVAVKTTGTVVSQGLDTFYQNAGTSPKMVYDVAGTLVWSPHNMLIQSANLQLSWTFTNAAATSATFLRPDTTNAFHRALAPATVGVIGETYTHSALLSAGGYSKIGFSENGTANSDVAFDLNAGTKLYQAANASGTITAQGGGQYLITVTVVAAGATARFMVYVLSDSYTTGAISASWVPDGVKGINIFRQQTNRGPVPTAYLPTTTAARFGLALDYDPVTHVAKGLLVEPAATNLILNNASMSTQSVTVTAVAHTLSFTGAGTLTLSGVSTAGPLVGVDPSTRVSLTFTPTAGSLTLTVAGSVNRAQLETGTVATSFIPTFAATATRAADNYSFLLSTIPALGSEYSVYCRFSTAVTGTSRHAYAIGDGTAAEYTGIFSGAQTVLQVVDNSVTQASLPIGTYTAGVFTSTASRIKANDFAYAVDGSVVQTDIVGTLPTVTTVKFGSNTTIAQAIFNIQKFMIVMPGWANGVVQTKSAS